MRNKTPLALMEQLIMLLVFALAAALCLKAFLWSDQTGQALSARDEAVLRTRNAAELVKYYRGDLALAADETGAVQPGLWEIGYDENWQEVSGSPTYLLRATLVEDDIPLLGRAEIELLHPDGTILSALDVCWQEVAP